MTRVAPRSAGAGRHRLTDVERAERKVSGGDLQRQITDLATMFGWAWLHIRPGLRANGRWYVPVEGLLGKGWPDLTLVRGGRLVFAELKRQTDDAITPEQDFVLGLLRLLDYRPEPSIEVHIWRPSDLRDPIETSPIYEVLR
jgi:hypothetical protein